jgi:hypothetical protein
MTAITSYHVEYQSRNFIYTDTHTHRHTNRHTDNLIFFLSENRFLHLSNNP